MVLKKKIYALPFIHLFPVILISITERKLVCCFDLTISHGGRGNVLKHVETPKHIGNVQHTHT